MERRTSAVLGAAIAGLLVSGCATEAYVDEQIAAVSGRLETVSSRVANVEGGLQQANARLETLDQNTQTALQTANKAMQGKINYAVLSEQDAVTFDTNKWNLSEEAQTTLTAFAERLKSENKGVYIEIVGHGDPRGSVYNNRILGEKRALEVRRFLTSQGIPLNRMETVSWGEERQRSEGAASADSNAANRVVTLRVLG